MYSSSLAMNSFRAGTNRLAPSPSNTTGRPSTLRRSNSLELDYMIGDKVIVGSKPGIIAYLGDVKFATGDFAGVVLDEPVGKNDGSMKGTRYFQCDPQRGVFVRTSKLVRNTNIVSPATRASPKSNTSQPLTTSARSSTSRSKSSSSTCSAPPSATEEKSFSPILDTACKSTECRVKTEEQMQKIQKEYEGLMAGTRQKLEEFQVHIDKLEKDNGELHKTIEEQQAKIEDLQFQLEEEVLSKEDVMQELVNAQNNNQSVGSVAAISADVRAAELHKQLNESLSVNSSLKEELEQVKAQLSDIEFQLAENESEKDNEIKEKKKLEDQISKLKSQSASKATTTNQSDSSLSTQSVTMLNQQLASKTSQLKTLQRNYSKLEAKVKQLLEKINSIETQHNQDKLLFSQSHDSLVNQHKIDIDTLNDDHSKELHRHQQKHAEDINSLHEKHKLAIQQLHTEHDTKLTSLRAELQELSNEYVELSEDQPSCSQCMSNVDELNQLRSQATEMEASKDEQVHRLSSQVHNLTAEKQRLNNAVDSKSQMVNKLKQQVLETQQQLTSWQREVKGQVEANRLQSEQDLDRLRNELESSQGLLQQLERKLSLSERENCKLQSKVTVLSNELHHVKQALVAATPRGTDCCDEAYRDTSDFLFNELRHQIEVMELNLLKTNEEDQRLKDENEQLKAELSQARYDLCGKRNSRRNSLPRIFCDTCGAFDLHPTVQCSRPHSTSTTSQSNLLCGFQKQPHCKICNSQSHWTADCTIDE